MSLLFTGLQLLLQLLIINYLYQLENKGCDCAMDYKRKYILGYMVLNVVFVILSMFTNVLKNAFNSNIGSLLMSLYAIGGIVNIVFIIEYVNLLKEKHCECSESVYRDLIYVFSILDACTLVMSFLLALFVLVQVFFCSKKKNKVTKGKMKSKSKMKKGKMKSKK